METNTTNDTKPTQFEPKTPSISPPKEFQPQTPSISPPQQSEKTPVQKKADFENIVQPPRPSGERQAGGENIFNNKENEKIMHK